MRERTVHSRARSAAREAARKAADDAARVTAFRELARRLRTDAGVTQGELAERMGTTQSAIARLESGGVRPTLETLERLAHALGHDLVVGVGPQLGDHRSIAKLERDGHGVVRRAR